MSKAEKDFELVVVAPACGKALVLQSELGGLLVLEQRQGDPG